MIPIRLRFSVTVTVALAALAAQGEVMLPGVASSQLDPQLKGQVLIEELNCAACHESAAAFAAASKKAHRLAEVGSRVNPAYIEAFIRDPHGTKPGTTMPDVLSTAKPDDNA